MNRKTIALILIMAVVVLTACGRDRESASETPTTAPTVAPVVEKSAEEAPAQDPTTAEEASAEKAAASGQEESPLDAPESPLAGPESPLDAPESPLEEPAVEPPALDAITGAETGALIGRILVSNSNGENPVVNMKVALAEVIRDEEGVARVAGYEPAVARRTASDDLGRFALNELDPGTYAIILDAVITSIMLNDPVTGETILVDIKAGEVVDLGRLDYESLALPGYVE